MRNVKREEFAPLGEGKQGKCMMLLVGQCTNYGIGTELVEQTKNGSNSWRRFECDGGVIGSSNRINYRFHVQNRSSLSL